MKKLHLSEDTRPTLEEVIGKCIGILGIRGSGKSNSAGVIFEELLKHNYPLTVVDIDGEYFGLKEKFELLVIGVGENVDLEIDPEDAEKVAEISLERSIPVVLDLSGYLMNDQKKLLKNYLTRVWNLAGKLRKPYMIGIEEAHEYIPQGKNTELKEIISRIALRGRKRGLGAVIISQRSAKVEKDVLTQAGILFLHRVVHEADMRVYSELLPWPKRKVKEKVGMLDTGDCILLGGNTIKKIHLRERETFHAGFTPTLETVETPQLKQISGSILKAIEEAKKKQRQKKDRMQEMSERLEDLENEMQTKDEKIAELKEVARTLGYIKVDLKHPNPPQVQRISKMVVERLSGAGMLKEGADGEAAQMVTETLTKSHPKDGHSEQPESEESVERSKQSRISEESGKKVYPPDTCNEKQPTNGGCQYEDLPRPVRKRVEQFLDTINQKEPLKKKILVFLMKHRPFAYSIHQIASWLDVSSGLIMNNRPGEFIHLGLITQENKMGSPHYRLTLKSFVENHFSSFKPDIGIKQIQVLQKFIEKKLIELEELDSSDQAASPTYQKATR